MAGFIIPKTGEQNLLTTIIENGNNLIFHLFKNAHLVNPTSVEGNMDEADYSGYAEQIIGPIAPTLADSYLGLPGDKAYSGLYQPVFPGNSGADQVVYGVYVTYQDPVQGTIFMGAANCFGPIVGGVPTGRTISGSGDMVPIAFTLRLWDYLTHRPTRSKLVFGGMDFSNWPQGDTQSPTITAIDENGNIDGSYNGTVYLFSSDTTAAIDNHTVMSSGTGVFNALFITTGPSVLGAADPLDPPIAGGTDVTVVSV